MQVQGLMVQKSWAPSLLVSFETTATACICMVSRDNTQTTNFHEWLTVVHVMHRSCVLRCMDGFRPQMSTRLLIVMVHMVSISLMLKTFIHGVSGHHALHEYLCLVACADACARGLCFEYARSCSLRVGRFMHTMCLLHWLHYSWGRG